MNLTLSADIFDHEIERAIKTIGTSSEQYLYLQVLTEFRNGRGIRGMVSMVDMIRAAWLRGAARASQRDERSTWEEILAADLARATHPARGGEGGTR
ncbi:hypothetical protein [Glutamicibacter sp. V16R2B1]|uniref:hypothetical protein n=1 Tax=Glutamicibacter sp. V16R2B1 TaxID=2036207 RepID=UPI0010FD3091|nr:hypothetical protein [Glutamicibacter sp. V16R2B1]MCK9901340.1 hypothetical protein [Frankia sp. Cpl3]TLK47808.1 hypothetical protein FDN03_15610 [Glutamicibacter sp. V16R2B1]